MGLLERLYIGGDIERPDRRQRQAAVLAPREEPVARPHIGAPGIRVADVGGKEFDIAPAGSVAGVGDQRRHQGGGVGVHRAREHAGRDDRRELVGLVRGVRIEGIGFGQVSESVYKDFEAENWLTLPS
jgi:hypothetical protein